MSTGVICTFFNSRQGCRNGDSCRFVHERREPTHAARPVFPSTTMKSAPLRESVQRPQYASVPVESLWEDNYEGGQQRPPVYADILKSNIDPDEQANILAQHEVSTQPTVQTREVCNFYLAGTCKFGNRCRYLHPAPEDIHIPIAEDTFKSQPAAPIECGICIEAPKGSLYGVLSHCNCKFCLTCIREWRTDGVAVTKDQKQVRVCPLCRKVSYFVVPSSVFPEGDEKELLLQTYKESLARKPCRHYQQGNCPFGSSCFYLHEADGSKGVEITKRNAGQQKLSDLLNIDNLIRKRRNRTASGAPQHAANDYPYDAEEEFQEFLALTDGMRDLSTEDES